MFGGSDLDKEIEAYIEQIVSRINCSKEERVEMIDEIRDHLYLLKKDFVAQGLSEAEATVKVLKQFGDQKQISKGLQESLFPYYKWFKIGTWIMFSFYAAVVLYKLLIERIINIIADHLNGFPISRYVFLPPDFESYFHLEVLQLNANIIPFKNTLTYITGLDKFNLDVIIHNTVGNILIFLPLGVFLPLLFKKCRPFTKVLLISVIISIFIECSQLFFMLGQFDIDDIILNVSGSMVGFLLFKSFNSIGELSKKPSFKKVV